MMTAAAAIVALVASAAPAGALRPAQPNGGRPQLDVRARQRTPVPAGVRAARRSYTEQLGIESHLATDPVGGGVRVLDRTNGFLSGRHTGDAAAIGLAWARGHADVFGLTSAQIGALTLTGRTTSNDGVTHLTWVPEVDGIPAYDSELRVHVARDGRVLAASGPPIGVLSIPSATPKLTAAQALAVAQNDVGAPFALPRSTTSPGRQRETTFVNGDHASLVVFQAPSGDRLAWRITVSGRGPYMYDEAIDAGTGAVLVRHSLTDFASSAHVFFYHPGAAVGGAATQVDLSPWLTSTTSLSGPYAHAYADPNDDGNGNDGTPVDIPPSSGTDWEYPQTPVLPGSGQSCSPFGGGSGICTWDGTTTGSELRNRAQVTTQVFYYVNNYHQWLAQDPIDFNDASGNFEVGGTGGSDPVKAETDDSILGANPQVDNANMSTPPDGQSPRMQMYLFDSPFPAVNGGDDASVVYHEYTHGLSNRLIDNANGLNDNQPRAMGEGWSDWYAMDYLVANGYASDTAADGEVVVGEYATGDVARGIRYQPLDCSVGSSAPNCSGSPTTAPGGFTYADLGHVGSYDGSTPRFEVHDDGEIWSETLWDLRKALGAFTARKLVTNAMRLSPADPSYLDERDAILLADEADGGANHDAIWQVFANRGMGYGASTTSPNATTAIASFAMPRLVAPAATTLDDAAPLGDGNGAAEPGEVVRVTVGLTNPGLVGLTNVHGTLSSSTPGVSVLAPDADYGAVAAGATAQDATPFAIAIASSVACGGEVPLTLHVTSDQGTLDVPVVVALGSGRTTFSASPNATIPDASGIDVPGAGLTTQLTVGSSGRIDRLRVTVDITHPWTGDLQAWLTSPSGTTETLFERPGVGYGGSGFGGMTPVTFDDGASQSIQEVPFENYGPAISGTYRPDGALSAFAGENRAGTWRLHIVDAYPGDQGTLVSWSLDTDQPACSASLALPSATTGAASGVTATGATLGGSVDPGGEATTYRFDYGTTSAYGQSTAEAPTGGGSGATPQSTAVSGLAPSTTYHFRVVALRGGIPVTFGADQTFATTAASSGGGGGSGGGSTGGGSGGGTTGGGGGGGSTSPGGSVAGGGGGTPSTVAKPTGVTAKATIKAHLAFDVIYTFTYGFRATPGLHGTIRFTIPKHGRTKAVSFGTKTFVVASNGRVKLTVKVGGKALAQLRKLHTAKVNVTIVLDGKAFSFTLRLSAPTPRPRHR